MGIEVSGLANIADALSKSAQKYTDAFLYKLNYIGMDCVRYVRDRTGEESWFDQTGNLRSSIGYIIVQDGRVLYKSDFESVDGPKRTESLADGSQEGSDYADSLASRYPTGYALIIVAGMEYAAALEELDNKDVLASGELMLEEKLDELIKDFKNIVSV